MYSAFVTYWPTGKSWSFESYSPTPKDRSLLDDVTRNTCDAIVIRAAQKRVGATAKSDQNDQRFHRLPSVKRLLEGQLGGRVGDGRSGSEPTGRLDLDGFAGMHYFLRPTTRRSDCPSAYCHASPSGDLEIRIPQQLPPQLFEVEDVDDSPAHPSPLPEHPYYYSERIRELLRDPGRWAGADKRRNRSSRSGDDLSDQTSSKGHLYPSSSSRGVTRRGSSSRRDLLDELSDSEDAR